MTLINDLPLPLRYHYTSAQELDGLYSNTTACRYSRLHPVHWIDTFSERKPSGWQANCLKGRNFKDESLNGTPLAKSRECRRVRASQRVRETYV
jgi:hypothetical protein